jgi:hypothetical protein
MAYSPTSWVDDVTVADAAKLNNIETGNTYTATTPAGVIASTAADTGTPTSGLRTVMNAIIAHGVSVFFPPGTYSFPEDPAGVQDHWAVNDVHNLTLVGVPGQTILSNWRDDTQGGYDTNADTEPFSFTRAHGLYMSGFVIWHGGNPDANTSCDAMDFDGCEGATITNCIVERSRARGIIFDGGDQGATSAGSKITNCTVRGVPTKPSIWTIGGSSMTNQEYRYVITYVDSYLGETAPSDIGSYLLTNSNTLRIELPIGPSYDATRGVTQRRVYRWSAGQQQWRRLVTVNNNTDTYVDDSASDASISGNTLLATNSITLIPGEGIKTLGGENIIIANNWVHGIDGHGIQTARKGSGTTIRPPKAVSITGNIVRRVGLNVALAGRAGIMTAGGDRHLFGDNIVSNVGTVTNKGIGIYCQGLTDCTTAYNMIGSNVIYDDGTAASPQGGATTNYAVQVTGTPAPDNTVIAPHVAQGMVAGDVNNGGTNTKQYAAI